jgi:hypothetical protein
MIREEYTSGASVIEIKNEVIKMELDKYTGSYTVAERKKNDALKSLVESNRLIILTPGKKSLKLYMAIIPKVCNGLTENIVSQDFADTRPDLLGDTGLGSSDLLGDTGLGSSDLLGDTGLGSSDLSGDTGLGSSDLLGENKKVRVIRKAYQKPTALQILNRPTVQESLNTFGYVTLGQNVVTIPSNTDEGPGEAMMSASREILLSKTDKRSRPRATGNSISFDTDFPDFIINFVFNHMYL